MFAWGEDILWLLVLIGVMIMIHEAGHYWAARYFNVKVEVFSFGFGPRLFGFRRGHTNGGKAVARMVVQNLQKSIRSVPFDMFGDGNG